MFISSVELKGFRNFNDAIIKFREQSLIIGANDVGKSNLIWAIRLLLDRSISENDIAPQEADFHVSNDGKQSSTLSIQILLKNVYEDAVLSKLKGWVSDDGSVLVEYNASLDSLEYTLRIGASRELLEGIDGRIYLKYIHFRFIQSYRDLSQIIRKEKKELIKRAKSLREDEQITSDKTKEETISGLITDVNDSVNKLSYIIDSTNHLNTELKQLSHHHGNSDLSFMAGSVSLSSFIERLNLRIQRGDKSIMYGGDGRNNQIAISIWKTESVLDCDNTNEAYLFCIEEPEAHLHPHQQRKLAQYVTEKLPGQVIVSTHSPQITSEFSPENVIRLYEQAGCTVAASNGCSLTIEETWKEFGYRMSILPAECFFSDAVILVEGPSELQFYKGLCKAYGIDLDFYNISILEISGIAFEAYWKILKALEIPCVIRTDNDVSKVPKKSPQEWQLAGINRALSLLDKPTKDHILRDNCMPTDDDVQRIRDEVSEQINPDGIFLSKWDLEHDLSEILGNEMMQFAKADTVEKAVAYLQEKKAIRMTEFLSSDYVELANIPKNDPLFTPIQKALELIGHRAQDHGQD